MEYPKTFPSDTPKKTSMRFVKDEQEGWEDYEIIIGYILIPHEEVCTDDYEYTPFHNIGFRHDDGFRIPVHYMKRSEKVRYYKGKFKKDRQKNISYIGMYNDELPVWACRSYENFINGKTEKIRMLPNLHCFIDADLNKFHKNYPDELFDLWELKQGHKGNHILFFEGNDDTSYTAKFKTKDEAMKFLDSINEQDLFKLLYYN